VHRAQQHQYAQPPPEERERVGAAARKLQAEPDPEQQREHRIELAGDEDVLDRHDDPVGPRCRELDGDVRRRYEQAEKDEHVREEDAADGHASKGVEGRQPIGGRARREGRRH
jgi:hypothetical protein